MDVKNVPLKGLSSSDTEEENFTSVLIADLVVVGGYFDELRRAIRIGLVTQIKTNTVSSSSSSLLPWVLHSTISIYFKDHNFFVEPNQTFTIFLSHDNTWEFMLGNFNES